MSLQLAPCGVNESPDAVFDKWTRSLESLNAEQIHILYGRLRIDAGMNLAQVRDVVQLICGSDSCNRDEFTAVLKELDRRYALLADVHWEFNLLAQHYRGSITEQDALFLFKAVYDGYKWQCLWDQFISSRGQTGTRITWDEIELPLCALLGSLEVAESDSEERMVYIVLTCAWNVLATWLASLQACVLYLLFNGLSFHLQAGRYHVCSP